MPGRDGTGPMGAGPATGWGRGFCRGGGAFGRGAGYGAGYGWGRGGGRRLGAAFAPGAHRRAGWWHAAPPADERSLLESEEAALRAELEAVQRRLGELAGSPEVAE